MKATFALGDGRRAVLSHHLGDLDHPEAYRAFVRDATLYEELFAFGPACIAHDLHPDYASTRYAIERGKQLGIPCIAVQHHHAHMASCMAEHALNEPVIGVTFDGTGFGTDGTVWGGEFLVGDYLGFHRAAHLRPVGMPGGEAAVREPWRMAAAHLRDAQARCDAYDQRIPAATLRTMHQMIDRRFNTPLTSSAGRLFDAVASLAGVRDRVAYEGQAAMQWEWLATAMAEAGIYPFELCGFLVGVRRGEGADDENSKLEAPSSKEVRTSNFELDSSFGIRDLSFPRPDPSPQPSPPGTGERGPERLIIDTRPLIRAIASDVDAGLPAALIARRFHSTLVEMVAEVCRRIRESTRVNAVVLSGGVFMNALLAVETSQRLSRENFRVYRHRLVPPNDAGLSLGQVAVAAACCGLGSAVGSPSADAAALDRRTASAQADPTREEPDF
jgi:hydrogenase maturation protein HypF